VSESIQCDQNPRCPGCPFKDGNDTVANGKFPFLFFNFKQCLARYRVVVIVFFSNGTHPIENETKNGYDEVFQHLLGNRNGYLYTLLFKVAIENILLFS
jgi:hypothetical protein